MDEQNQSLADLEHIKKMMERSSRFISLSGLSGIAAGICALIGAWFAEHTLQIRGNCLQDITDMRLGLASPCTEKLDNLLWIATLTFIAAFISAFFFTYLRSKKNKVSMWGPATVRLLWNTVIPIAVGGVFILRMMNDGYFSLIAPGCLIFYGLALVNASKYTLGEVRYLGYGQLLLGIINLCKTGDGLYFWAIGFGVLHIIYGIAMWWKYERRADTISH